MNEDDLVSKISQENDRLSLLAKHNGAVKLFSKDYKKNVLGWDDKDPITEDYFERYVYNALNPIMKFKNAKVGMIHGFSCDKFIKHDSGRCEPMCHLGVVYEGLPIRNEYDPLLPRL